MTTAAAVAAPFDVAFSRALFSGEALKRAAYTLMNRAGIAFDVRDDLIVCTISPVRIAEDAVQLEADYRREVLDQELRLKIAEETDDLRNAILALAFSRTGLQG